MDNTEAPTVFDGVDIKVVPQSVDERLHILDGDVGHNVDVPHRAPEAVGGACERFSQHVLNLQAVENFQKTAQCLRRR